MNLLQNDNRMTCLIVSTEHECITRLLLQVEYLLYELREPILLTACKLTLRTEMKAQMRPYVDIYVTLASVCDGFYEVVRDRRFKRIIKRCLKGLLLAGWTITFLVVTCNIE